MTHYYLRYGLIERRCKFWLREETRLMLSRLGFYHQFTILVCKKFDFSAHET